LLKLPWNNGNAAIATVIHFQFFSDMCVGAFLFRKEELKNAGNALSLGRKHFKN